MITMSTDHRMGGPAAGSPRAMLYPTVQPPCQDCVIQKAQAEYWQMRAKMAETAMALGGVTLVMLALAFGLSLIVQRMGI